jgi:ABC-type nitrate/sulfonate/bicarbonate transport system substrate-binding protein
MKPAFGSLSRTLAALLLVVLTSNGLRPALAQTPDVPGLTIATYGKGAGEWCLYVAQQNKYLEQAKVKLNDWLVVFGDPLIVNALISGQADLAISSTGAIVPVANGQTDQIVTIGGSEGYPVSLVAPDTITSPAQLIGKTISLPPNNTSLEIIGTKQIDLLLGHGKYDSIYSGGNDATHFALIAGGKAQAVLVNDPVTLDPSAHLHIIARLNGGQSYFNGPLMASKKFLQAKPDTAIRFLAAFAKGCNYILDPKNRVAAVNILASVTGVSHEACDQFYDFYVAGAQRGHTPPKDARVDEKGFEATIELMKQAGVITNKAFVSKTAVDNSYLDKALKLAATLH